MTTHDLLLTLTDKTPTDRGYREVRFDTPGSMSTKIGAAKSYSATTTGAQQGLVISFFFSERGLSRGRSGR